MEGFNGLHNITDSFRIKGYKQDPITGESRPVSDFEESMSRIPPFESKRNTPETAPAKKEMTFKDLMNLFGLTGQETGNRQAYAKVKQWIDNNPGYVPGKLTKQWLNNNVVTSTPGKNEEMENVLLGRQKVNSDMINRNFKTNDNTDTKATKTTDKRKAEYEKELAALRAKYPEYAGV